MSEDQLLLIEVNEQTFGLPCAHVLEILLGDNTHAVALPAAKGIVQSVLMHREKALPILEMRTVLNHPSFEEELDELKQMLAARERDHVAWLEELKRCCSEGDPFTKATDPHMCAFGQWYDGLKGSEKAMRDITKGDRELHYIISQFDAPHCAIHGIATEALRCAGDGDLDGANKIIENAWNTELSAMRTLFAMLVEKVFEKHKVLYVTLEVNKTLFAAAVDKALLLIPFDREHVQEVDFAGEAITGVYTHEKRNILVIDPGALARMMDLATPCAA